MIMGGDLAKSAFGPSNKKDGVNSYAWQFCEFVTFWGWLSDQKTWAVQLQVGMKNVPNKNLQKIVPFNFNGALLSWDPKPYIKNHQTVN